MDQAFLNISCAMSVKWELTKAKQMNNKILSRLTSTHTFQRLYQAEKHMYTIHTHCPQV